MNRFNTSHRLAAGIALGLMAVATGASAQTQPTQDADTWHYAIGAAALSQPRYPGSDREKTRVLPIATATHGRFALGVLDGTGIPVGGSMDLVDNDHWKVGIALGTDIGKPRKESDSPRLKGLGDIDPTLLTSVFARYDASWFEIRGNVVTDIGDRHNGFRTFYDPESRTSTSEGTRASIDFEGKYTPMPGLTVFAGPGLVWADRRYQRTFFGVDGQQSANSGLATYSPKAGINAIRMTLGADYQVSPHWSVGAALVGTDLRGDAANSPVTERRWQRTAALVTTYRF